MDIDKLIQMAAMIATNSAMNGNPLESLQWIPPTTATESQDGAWSLTPCKNLGGSDRAPWDI